MRNSHLCFSHFAHPKDATKKFKEPDPGVLQQVTFRAEGQTRRTNNVLKGVAMGDVGASEECKWEDSIKNIPPVPPSRLGGGCKNIEVKYVLAVC